MACLMLEWTGRMFLWISSMGPGRWEILSFKPSVRRAFFSRSCLAWRDGSADVSGTRQKPNDGHFVPVCSDPHELCVTPASPRDTQNAARGSHLAGCASWSVQIASSWDSPHSGQGARHAYHFSITHSLSCTHHHLCYMIYHLEVRNYFWSKSSTRLTIYLSYQLFFLSLIFLSSQYIHFFSWL